MKLFNYLGLGEVANLAISLALSVDVYHLDFVKFLSKFLECIVIFQ